MAPNFSKFYDDALKEGLGLVEFIERHHPGEAELKEIKPKMEMPYKGYFPAGKICDTFGKKFKSWARAFTGSGRGDKNQKMLEFMVLRINKTEGFVVPFWYLTKTGLTLVFIAGLSLTKADLILSGSGSTPGSNAGGGYSWIHPRLMTHFLQWCCPEFAEEVLDVFQRYLSGDASLVAESASIRAAALEKQLEAAQHDLLARQELLQTYQTEAAEFRAKATEAQEAAAKQEKMFALQLADVNEQIEEIRQQGEGKYEDLVRAHLEAVQRQREALQDKEAQLQTTTEELARDSARPLNIFRHMDPDVIPESNRNSEPELWLPARNITTNACIYFARANYRLFVSLVSERSIGYKPFVLHNIDYVNKVLRSNNRCARYKVKHATTKMLFKLPKRDQESVVNGLYERLREQMEQVFAFVPDRLDFTLKQALNNITMYSLLCKYLKNVYDVEYSTEIETRYLAKMALNFNEYTGGECVIPLGPDYDENVDMLADVVLKTF